MGDPNQDLKELVAGLAKQFVEAVNEARVRTVEECAGYVERASPCHCRRDTARAIRNLAEPCMSQETKEKP